MQGSTGGVRGRFTAVPTSRRRNYRSTTTTAPSFPESQTRVRASSGYRPLACRPALVVEDSAPSARTARTVPRDAIARTRARTAVLVAPPIPEEPYPVTTTRNLTPRFFCLSISRSTAPPAPRHPAHRARHRSWRQASGTCRIPSADSSRTPGTARHRPARGFRSPRTSSPVHHPQLLDFVLDLAAQVEGLDDLRIAPETEYPFLDGYEPGDGHRDLHAPVGEVVHLL